MQVAGAPVEETPCALARGIVTVAGLTMRPNLREGTPRVVQVARLRCTSKDLATLADSALSPDRLRWGYCAAPPRFAFHLAAPGIRPVARTARPTESTSTARCFSAVFSPCSMKATISAARQHVVLGPSFIGAGARPCLTQLHQVDAATGTMRNTSLSRITLFGSHWRGGGGLLGAGSNLAGFIFLPPRP